MQRGRLQLLVTVRRSRFKPVDRDSRHKKSGKEQKGGRPTLSQERGGGESSSKEMFQKGGGMALGFQGGNQ